MTATGKIPATVVTGFLGAGKTTLIRHLIENARGRRLALIVNEFGDVGIDGELLRGCSGAACGDDDIFELANGCICCTVADDFLPTIQRILARPAAPEHIVIETSGLALPKPLVQAFNWPEVRTRVTVDGVVTVIDGPAVQAGTFAADPAAVALKRAADDSLEHDSPLNELFEDQLACADLVLLNKADLLDGAALAEVATRLGENLRPGVGTIHTRFGIVDPAVVLGLDMAAEDHIAARPTHHDPDQPHDHDEFESFIVDLGAIGEPHTLVGRLHDAVTAHPILRIKGFAHVAGKDMRLVLQGVGRRIQHYYDREWHDGERRSTRLVVIGAAGLDRAAIRAAIGAAVGG